MFVFRAAYTAFPIQVDRFVGTAMSELQQPSSRSGERVHVSAGRGASATPNGLLQDGADATHTAAAPVAAASAELEEWVTLRADPDPDDTAPFAGAVEVGRCPGPQRRCCSSWC